MRAIEGMPLEETFRRNSMALSIPRGGAFRGWCTDRARAGQNRAGDVIFLTGTRATMKNTFPVPLSVPERPIRRPAGRYPTVN